MFVMTVPQQENTKADTRQIKASVTHMKICYLRGLSIQQIADKFGVSYGWVYKISRGKNNKGVSWETERDLLWSETLDGIKKHKVEILQEIVGVSLEMIRSSLKNMAAEGEPLKLKDVHMLTEIITNFDKIQRLDDGKPTDIHKDVTLSIEDIRDAIEKDKFTDLYESKKEILDADYSDVKHELPVDIADVLRDEGQGIDPLEQSGDMPENDSEE